MDGYSHLLWIRATIPSRPWARGRRRRAQEHTRTSRAERCLLEWPVAVLRPRWALFL